MNVSDFSSISLEEFQRQVTEQLAQERRQEFSWRQSNVAQEPLLWLALPPGWTTDLARRAGFPAGTRDVDEVFEELTQQGFLDKYQPPPLRQQPAQPAYYVMTRNERAQVLDAYRHDRDNLPALRTALVDVGQRIGKQGEGVPAAVQVWAQLAARAGDSQALAQYFDEGMAEAYNQKDAGQIHHWIEAARPLARLLAWDLENNLDRSIRRASLLLELLSRTRHDDQHLKHFLKRTEQIDPVHALINGRDDQWALHFIGAGGVGKTMLVRYISSQRSKKEEGWNVHTARIDFDYINPNYPRLDPGLLLWSFAQELRIYDTGGTATSLFDAADRMFRSIHEELKAGTAEGQRGTDHPRFPRALRFYIDALKALPLPVLLIVDTCEELAKAGPWSTARENVTETFRILKALHDGPRSLTDPKAPPEDGVSKLRVIFAGRRPLASAGYGWRCPSSLPEQPFLSLREIRGFDVNDARRYLETVRVNEALIPPIIRKSSPDAGSVVEIVWDDPRHAPVETPRCNPYDLRLFIDWARETPPPTPEQIEGATSEQYVEFRILRRLRNEALARILPALALLKYYDRDLLRAMSDLDQTDFDVLYESLTQQEWIERHLVVRPGSQENRLILYMEEGLRLRLLEYYQSHGDTYTAYRQRAAAYLEKKTLHEALDVLEKTDFDAALRALEAEPARARAWWQQVEERILAAYLDANPQWILSLTDFLVGEEGEGAAGRYNADRGPRAQPESRQRPAVLATHAAALLHTSEARPAGALWWEVSTKRTEAPVPGADALLLRARAGQVVAACQAKELTEGQVAAFWADLGALMEWPDPETASALVAAAEALVEQGEAEAAEGSAHARALLFMEEGAANDRLAGLLTSGFKAAQQAYPNRNLGELVAFACVLAGRAQALLGDYETASAWFVEAFKHSDGLPSQSRRYLWAYWKRPAALAARSRLEAVRCLYPAFLPPEEVVGFVGTGPSQVPETIDDDRLQAALTRVALDVDLPVKPPEAAALYKNERARPDLQKPLCNAHRETPPAFVAAAETMAARGEIRHALSVLREASNDDSYPLELKLHGERLLARLLARMRLHDEGEAGGRSLVESPMPSDQALFGILRGLDGAKDAGYQRTRGGAVVDPGSNALLHAEWQTRYALDGVQAKRLLDGTVERIEDVLKTSFSASDVFERSFGDVSVLFDGREAHLLGLRWSFDGEPLAYVGRPATSFLVNQWSARHPHEPVEALTLVLRYVALVRPPVDVSDLSGEANLAATANAELVQRVGLRRAAELALHEGDLVSLRLPVAAAVLYRYAFGTFQACEDPVDTFIAGVALAGTIPQRNDQERAASPVDLGRILDAVMDAYTGLLAFLGERREGLPSVEMLTALPTTGNVDLLNAVQRIWRPWIVRLAGVLVWNAQEKQRDLVRSVAEAMPEQWPRRAKLLTFIVQRWTPKKETNPLRWFLEKARRRFSWFLRMLARGLGIGHVDPRVEETSRALRQWLVDHYSATVDGRVALPADFTYLADSLPKEPPPGNAVVDVGETNVRGVDLEITFKEGYVEIGDFEVSMGEWEAEDLREVVRKGGRRIIEREDHVEIGGVRLPKRKKESDTVEGNTGGTTVEDQDGVEARPEPATSAPKLSVLRTVLSVLLGLGVWAGLFVGGFFLFRWLVRLVAPDAVSSEFDWWGTYVLALVGIGVLGVLYGQLRAAWTRRYGTEVHIESRTSEDSGYTEFAEQQEVRLVLHVKRPRLSPTWSFLDRLSQTYVSEVMHVAGVRSYAEAAQVLQEASMQPLVDAIRRAQLKQYPINLIADPEVQGMAWEALFTLALRERGIPLERTTFRRATRTIQARIPPSERHQEPVVVRSWVGDTQGQEVARRGWQPLAERLEIELDVSDGREGDVLVEPKDAGSGSLRRPTVVILHLVGSVEESGAGLRFRIAGEASSAAVQKASLPGSDDRYLRSEEIQASFPNLNVCVVQEELQDLIVERGGSDRIKAALARTFAARLFESGIPVVIFLPALRPETAVEVLKMLAATIGDRPKRGTEALLRAMHAIRQTIQAASEPEVQSPSQVVPGMPEPGPRSIPEAALDGCLFCTEDWNGRKRFVR